MPTLAPKLPYTHPFAGGYPRVGGQPLPSDPDAIDYLERVKAADGGAAVEVGVAMAVDQFIKGCKADSAGYAGDPTRTVWDALKSACIMCGARTLAGALVSLRQYGPELWNASVTPTISDAGGSAGEWNADTLTMTNPSGGLVYFPIFTFGSIAATPGVQYRISGRFAGDFSHVSRISLGGADQNNPASSQDFSFTLTAVSSASFAINLRGTDAPSSVRIESLSIKEVINDATNVANNFVSSDYSRTTGLKGDGATKYLDTNRADNADPAGSKHYAVYATTTPNNILAGLNDGGVPSQMYYSGGNFLPYLRFGTTNSVSGGAVAGFHGMKRVDSSNVNARCPAGSTTFGSAEVLRSISAFVFARNNSGVADVKSSSRLAFYSIGSALDLAALDNRVTQLITGIKFHSLTGLVATDYDPDTVAYIVAAYEAGGTL